MLIWGVFFGAIGLGFFVYGKKQKRIVPYLSGIALIIFPYFVSNTSILVITGSILMVLPYFVRLWNRHYRSIIACLSSLSFSNVNMNSKVSPHSIRFQLAISSENFLAYYQGVARDIVVLSEDNRTLKFPASAIRSFLRHEGIFGVFEIHFDENNKLIAIKQISSWAHLLSVYNCRPSYYSANNYPKNIQT